MKQEMTTKFQEYQSRYESSFISPQFKEKWKVLQDSCHRLVSTMEPYVQGTELLVKSAQFSVLVLSYFPQLNIFFEIPRQICQDARRATDLLKGIKSIDSLLNLTFSWRHVTLTLSGMTLLVLSVVSIMDRLKLLNIKSFRINKLILPMFATLPFGGFLSFSLIGLLGMISLNTLDKRRKCIGEIDHLVSQKMIFWSKKIGLEQVKEKQVKYQEKVGKLKHEVEDLAHLIEEGNQVEHELKSEWKCQVKKMRACHHAIQELNSLMQAKKAILLKYETKSLQWKMLENKWNHVKMEEIENFRQAKLKKWKTRLQKLEDEKRACLFSVTSHMMTIFGQIFWLGSTIFSCQAMGVRIGLDVLGTFCNMKNFFMKREIRKIKLFPVKLEDFGYIIC